MAFKKLIKISGCSEEPNILLNAKSVLGLIKRISLLLLFVGTWLETVSTHTNSKRYTGFQIKPGNQGIAESFMIID